MNKKEFTTNTLQKTNKRQLISTLFTAILMLICIMLAVVGAALKTYHIQQKMAKQHLLNYAHLFSQTPLDDIETIKFSPKSKIQTFTNKTDLPKEFSQHFDNDKILFLSREKMKRLDWHNNFFDDAVIITKFSKNKETRYLAIEAPKRKIFQNFITIGLYLSIAILAIMLAYSLFSQARVRRRLAYISSAANEIVDGHLDKRISINPAIHDEYTEVSQTLNKMLDKNAQLMQDLCQVNNNIAHDLKSPLNRMRSRIDIALLNSRSESDYKSALANSIYDIDSLLKTFQSLLLMGNLDSDSRNYQLEPTSLSTILDKLAELYEVVAEDKQHKFTASIIPDITIFANPSLFAQAISNLLENAIKYTPSEGNLRLTLSKSGTYVLITIDDDGPGISADQHQQVFERFSRLDSARQLPGTGLGMSLVKSILKIHKATIQLHDNHPGLRVEIRIKSLSDS